MTVEACNALTARWAAAADGAGVFSGAGVYPLLALLAGVASGPARDELLAVAPSPLDLPDTDGVRAALGVWTRHDLPLDPSWTAGSPLSGDPAADQARLDAWAAERTGGLIPAMPVAVDEDTGVVLASALSVLTEWVQPFDDGILSPAAGPWQGRRLAALHRKRAAGDALAPLRVLAAPKGRSRCSPSPAATTSTWCSPSVPRPPHPDTSCAPASTAGPPPRRRPPGRASPRRRSMPPTRRRSWW
ncbi:hypothetical protein OHA72_19365 [Dactylosporangium sp. NBC_01737]|uniref:hypothetical protein n=1 Tax=Dactylosporangium sp. NBC_01737 TaxID=2975959 RepID=UPI002E0E5E5B|nr:hypothetical protein OHA72_19365 [Dactylosporangium sp. NBC_01737]